MTSFRRSSWCAREGEFPKTVAEAPGMYERDYGAEAQAAAEAHLDACFEALDLEEQAPPGVDVESPAIGAFCGCSTCCIRETLHAAWPSLRLAALNGVE